MIITQKDYSKLPINKQTRLQIQSWFKTQPNLGYTEYTELCKVLSIPVVSKIIFEGLRPSKFIRTKGIKSNQINSLNSDLGFIKTMKTKIFKEVLNAAYVDAYKLVDVEDLSALGRNLGFTPDFNLIIQQVIDYHNNLVTHRGVKEGTSYYKKVSNFVISLLERDGYPPVDEHNDFMLATGRIDKFPSALSELRPLYHIAKSRVLPVSRACDQIIRSLLAMNRSVDDYCELDLTSIITDRPYCKDTLERFKSFLKWKYSKLGIYKQKIKFNLSDMDIRTHSNGPNGVLRHESADNEALALKNSPYWESYKRFCEKTNQCHLIDLITRITDRMESELSPKEIKSLIVNTYLYRLMAVPDSGNKSRTIAMVSFWIQKALEPLVKHIRDVTNLLHPKTCSTMDQERGWDFVKQFLRPGMVYMDGSNWSDCFNAKWLSAVLEALYADDIKDDWWDLAVSPEFSLSKKKKVQYKVGQGMGINGSFDIATLAGLELLDFFYYENYQELYHEMHETNKCHEYYGEVGDDLNNYDPKELFYDFYANKIGIPINLSKSKQARISNLCAEFVSRNINFGQEVSKISFRLCIEAEKNPFMLPTLYNHIQERAEYINLNNLIIAIVNNNLFTTKLLCNTVMCGYLEKTIYQETTSIEVIAVCLDQYLVSHNKFKDNEHVNALMKFKSQLLMESQIRTPQVAYLISSIKKIKMAVSKVSSGIELQNIEVDSEANILTDRNLLSMNHAFQMALKVKLLQTLEKVSEVNLSNILMDLALAEEIDLVPVMRELDLISTKFVLFDKKEREYDSKRLSYKMHKLNALIKTFRIVDGCPVIGINSTEWNNIITENIT